MCGNNSPHVREEVKANRTPKAAAAHHLEEPATPPPAQNWLCPLCTYGNTPEKAGCDMCATANPNPPAPPKAVEQRPASPAVRAVSPARAVSPSKAGAGEPLSRIERLRLQMAEEARKAREKHGET